MNPDNCPKITKKDVMLKAKELGIEVIRGSFSRIDMGFMKSDWGSWYRKTSTNWIGLGQTNYMAMENLKALERIFSK